MNSGKFVRYDGEEQQLHPAVMVPFADSMRTLSIKALPAHGRGRLSCLRFVMRESGVAGARRTTRRQAGPASSRTVPDSARHESGDCIQPLLTVDAR
jgi:hypothetical protein